MYYSSEKIISKEKYYYLNVSRMRIFYDILHGTYAKKKRNESKRKKKKINLLFQKMKEEILAQRRIFYKINHQRL